jgi:hypothetical protein
MIMIIDFNSKKDKERLFTELKKCKPVPYQVELKIDRDKRSGQQNKYYHGIVVKILSDETGFTPDEMHETLKYKFLRYSKALPNGEEVQIIMSTTDLDTKEFEEYLEQIKRFAIQELDVYIPDPNEIIEI